MTTLDSLTTPPGTATAVALAAIPISLLTTTTLTQATGFVFVNDFYPSGVGPIGSTQTPASLLYATIEAYIAACPTALQSYFTSNAAVQPLVTDQCDWIAWLGAANYVYDSSPVSGGLDVSGATVLGSGQYIINRTITWNAISVAVHGTNGPATAAGSTRITYNGPDGTVNLPTPMFDFYSYDEWFAPPPGRAPGPQPGIKAEVKYINFVGKEGDIFANSQSVSGYISGIRCRAGTYCNFSENYFQGTLWDGIYFTAAQLFTKVELNKFYGVHRDAIAFQGVTNNYSTTMTVRKNEFGLVGRYGCFMDLNNSITARPVCDENSYEGAFNSFFIQNPEWFVHGVAAVCCIINGAEAAVHDSYYEGIVGPGAYDAGLHLVDTAPASISRGAESVLYITSNLGTSTAGIQYKNNPQTLTSISKASSAVVGYTGPDPSNGDIVTFYNTAGLNAGGMTEINGLKGTVSSVNTGAHTFVVNINTTGFGTFVGVNWRSTTGTFYLDITDARNYLVGGGGSLGANSRVYLRDLEFLGKIFFADSVTLDQTVPSSAENCNFSMWSIPVIAASARNGNKVTPIATAIPTYRTTPYMNFANVGTNWRTYGHFFGITQTGDYQLHGATTNGVATWSATTAFAATFDKNDINLAVRMLVVPTVGHANGYFYQATTAGTTGGSEPTWPTTPGGTVTDGSVVWTMIGQMPLDSENLITENMFLGRRERFDNAAPSTGRFAVADSVVNSGVTAAGTARWINTTAGFPGTFTASAI